MLHSTSGLLANLAQITPPSELAILAEKLVEVDPSWVSHVSSDIGEMNSVHPGGLAVTIRCGVAFQGEGNRQLVVYYGALTPRYAGTACWGWEGALAAIRRRLEERKEEAQCDPDPPVDRPSAVIIDYINWKNERGRRKIVPHRIEFTTSPWHPTPQWLLFAFDPAKYAERTFAMKDIHGWDPAAAGEKA